jgi:predicted RNA binding protein YcfA (HicA-like mRNA interferase family)
MASIDYRLLRSTTAWRLMQAWERYGFALNRQSGSHRQYKHPDRRRVTVSFHDSSDTFPLKTLRSMIEA